MICPRCDSPEGSDTLSVPLCDACLNDWRASGLAIPGPRLVEQPEMGAWLERPAEARTPYQPGPKRTSRPSRNGLVGVVFRLQRSKLEELKALSRRTRIRQSEYLREAIADLIAKHEGVRP